MRKAPTPAAIAPAPKTRGLIPAPPPATGGSDTPAEGTATVVEGTATVVEGTVLVIACGVAGIVRVTVVDSIGVGSGARTVSVIV